MKIKLTEQQFRRIMLMEQTRMDTQHGAAVDAGGVGGSTDYGTIDKVMKNRDAGTKKLTTGLAAISKSLQQAIKLKKTIKNLIIVNPTSVSAAEKSDGIMYPLKLLQVGAEHIGATIEKGFNRVDIIGRSFDQVKGELKELQKRGILRLNSLERITICAHGNTISVGCGKFCIRDLSAGTPETNFLTFLGRFCMPTTKVLIASCLTGQNILLLKKFASLLGINKVTASTGYYAPFRRILEPVLDATLDVEPGDKFLDKRDREKGIEGKYITCPKSTSNKPFIPVTNVSGDRFEDQSFKEYVKQEGCTLSESDPTNNPRLGKW